MPVKRQEKKDKSPALSITGIVDDFFFKEASPDSLI